ncbi:MAG: ABC transporter substrate-binding protein [Acidobacteriia bacterium]|nr:ABC transporter substrate-binding protein [Terriglobia bacterium]
MLRLAFLAPVVWLLCSCNRAPEKSLTIAVNAGVEGTALKTAAKEWGAAHGVKIEVVELPYANLFEKEQLDLSSRTGAYDVIMIDDPWFPRMADGLAALPHEPDADFIASCVAVTRAGGKTLALPYVGNSQLFFYRKDLFAKYKMDAPKTWDDVLAGAKKIGESEKMYGYVMRAAAGNAVVADFMPLLWAFGGDVLDASQKPVVDSPAAIDALRFMLQLGKYSPPGYAGFNADEVSAHLLQSTALMSINWPAWIAAMDDPAKSKVVDKIDFIPMPGERAPGVGELGTWLIAVPAASKHSADAFDFLFWSTDAPQQKQAALRGNPPTRRSVFQSPDLVGKFRAFPAQLAALESARPRPRTKLWNEIENTFGIYLSKANAGAMDPAAALHAASEEIAQILQRAR